jgi:hypothetical protein
MPVMIDHRIAQYSIERRDNRLVVANPGRLRDAPNERILEDVFGCLARLDLRSRKDRNRRWFSTRTEATSSVTWVHAYFK